MADPQLEEFFSVVADLDEELELFAIVDAARDEAIFPLVQELGEQARCLYAGKLPPALEQAAPYLVQMQPDAPGCAAILEQGWGESWGIFLAARGADLDALRSHFRRFLEVRDEQGNKLVFRFYDPRVFRVYLPTCTPEEHAYVYGPVGHYFVERAKGEGLMRYSFDGEELTEAEVQLCEAAADTDG